MLTTSLCQSWLCIRSTNMEIGAEREQVITELRHRGKGQRIKNPSVLLNATHSHPMLPGQVVGVSVNNEGGCLFGHHINRHGIEREGTQVGGIVTHPMVQLLGGCHAI